jgi:integrase
MASVFRPTYSDKKTGRTRKLRRWYVKYRDADGTVRRVRGYADKEATKQLAARLEKQAARRQEGMTDPFEEHSKRALAEHLADYERELLTRPRRGRKPPPAQYVGRKVGRIRRVLDGAGAILPADLTLERVQDFLRSLGDGAAPAGALGPMQGAYTLAEVAAVLGLRPCSINPLVRRHRLEATGNGKARRFPRATVEALLGLRDLGIGASTVGTYARDVKSFARWLVRRKRIAEDSLADLPGATTGSDHRHDRRPLSEDELRSLLSAALNSPETFRGLTGRDRHHLYLAAMVTGFRVGELAALVTDDFALAGEPPTVTLDGAKAKNGRTAVQPLPPDVALALRGYLGGRPAGEPVWPGTWPDRAAEMLRRDLAAAGIPYAVEGPDGPLYADFHSLRHSFVALLDKAGASLKQAMHLARHSDPKLTMARYGRPQLHDLGAAVERLPSLLPAGREAEATALKETGTTDTRGSRHVPQHVPAGDSGRDPLRLSESPTGGEAGKTTGPKPLILQEVAAGCDPVRGVDGSSGGWDRTSDLGLMKGAPPVETLLPLKSSGDARRMYPGMYPPPRLIRSWHASSPGGPACLGPFAPQY